MDARGKLLSRINLAAAAVHLVIALGVIITGIAKETASATFAVFRLRMNVTDDTFPDAVLSIHLAETRFSIFGVAVFIPLFTCFCHLLYGYLFTEKYLDEVYSGIHTHRWIEYCISAPLMADLLLFLSGGRDLVQLILCHAIFTGIMGCGYWTQVVALDVAQIKRASNGVWRDFLFALIVPCAIFIFWISSIVLSYTPNHSDAPSWVVHLLWILICMFTIFIAPLGLHLVQRWPLETRYVAVEVAYIFLSLVAKTTLEIVLAYNVFAA